MNRVGRAVALAALAAGGLLLAACGSSGTNPTAVPTTNGQSPTQGAAALTLPSPQVRALDKAHVPYIGATFPASETGLKDTFGVWIWRIWTGPDKGYDMFADGTSAGIGEGGCPHSTTLVDCTGTIGPGGLFGGTVASSVTSITAKFGNTTVDATVKPTGTARSIWVLPIDLLWRSPTLPVSIEATSATGQPIFAQESLRAAQQISSSVRSTAAFAHQHHMTFLASGAG